MNSDQSTDQRLICAHAQIFTDKDLEIVTFVECISEKTQFNKKDKTALNFIMILYLVEF